MFRSFPLFAEADECQNNAKGSRGQGTLRKRLGSIGRGIYTDKGYL